MTTKLTGKYVEVNGLTEYVNVRTPGKALAEQASSPQRLSPEEANGLQGLCIDWDDREKHFVVVTIAGDVLEIAPGHLEEIQPLNPEDGGFDVYCYLDGDVGDDFASSLTGCLAEKGFCLVQNFQIGAVRKEASSLARKYHDYQRFAPELAAGYLGRDSHNMKASWMSEDDPNAPPADALCSCDRDLTRLGYVVSSCAPQVLGVDLWGRTAGLLRLPFSSQREESRMSAEGMRERDVEEGKVQKFIEFCQRRRFLMLSLLECDGGDVLLVPEASSDGEGGMSLPLSPSKVLFVDLAAWAYHYRPVGQSVAIQAWLLTEQQPTLGALTFSGLDEEELFVERSQSGPAKPQGQQTQCVAIVTRTPGSVDWDFQQFIAMGVSATDAQICFPPDRFDWHGAYSPDKNTAMSNFLTYSYHGAFKDSTYVTSFDLDFCGVGPEPETNPAQMIVVESSYATLVNAGYTKETMRNKPISLYVGDNSGCMDWGIALSLKKEFLNTTEFKGTKEKMIRADQEHMNFALNQSITAQRPLYLFGLRGVGRTVDTACSASLVATSCLQADFSHNLSTSERMSEGMSAGVNTLNHVGPYISFCGNGMLSPQGRSFTFDASGDGYARGEGLCCLFWRRSARSDFAMEDRDAELSMCSLLGCIGNSDGRSASITAPNGPAQSQLIRISMGQAGLISDDVSASECHGTGTPLGDPIEIGALKVVWKDRTSGPMVLTSKKANVGHTESNAGLTGLTSCILMLRYSIGVTSVHLHRLNGNIEVAGYPVSFLSENYDFQTTNSAAGVSSFGVGGTNARADIWGRVRTGYLAERKRDPVKAHYVQKTCPICLGPMCWTCGAAIPTNAPYGKHHCSLIRDGVMDYNYCSMCYQGQYTFGALIEDERPKRSYDRVYAVGSWDSYVSMTELAEIDDGLYSCVVPIGETGYEQFYLELGGDRGFIYPVTDLAEAVARVEGPSTDSRGRQWLLDQRRFRESGMSSGRLPPAMRINLEWHDGIKRVFWEATYESPTQAEELARDKANRLVRRGYFIAGTFSTWNFQELQRRSGQDHDYQGSFTIGTTGFEEFRICRDLDWRQCFHPATSSRSPAITEPHVLVRGPDPHGEGKNWKVYGKLDERVDVKLSIDDGRITVSVISNSIGSCMWRSSPDDRAYYVVGSVTEDTCRLMQRDPDHPGVYMCEVEVRNQQEFQIVIDEDARQMLYPSSKHGRMGQCFTRGPDAYGHGFSWVIDDVPSGATICIVLDTSQADRRSMVFWTVPGSFYSPVQDQQFQLEYGDGE